MKKNAWAEALERTQPSRMKCEACKRFAWTSSAPLQLPVKGPDQEWHHPSCPKIHPRGV